MLRPLLPLFVVVTAFASTASAHHSQAGLFDSSKTIEITGVVKAISWRNPHGHITLAVTDDKGKVVDWDAETASISVLRNRGVDAEGIINVGDTITIAGATPRREVPETLATSVLLASGYEFTFGRRRRTFRLAKPARSSRARRSTAARSEVERLRTGCSGFGAPS